MLDRLLSNIPDGNKKFPLKFKRMINSISDRMWLARNRYLLAHDIPTPGMEMLRMVVQPIDIKLMDSFSSDVDRYTEYARMYDVKYRHLVDSSFSNSIAGGRFITRYSGTAPSEILINCCFADPLKEMPFDKDWIDWQRLRGVRLLYHNSKELPEDFARSMFEFKKEMPTYLIVSVNVPVLVMKYYKYVKSCEAYGQTPDVNYFLKEFEFSSFFEDLLDIWTLNLFLNILGSPTTTVDGIIDSVTVPNRFCTDNMLRQGIEGIKEFVDLLPTGALRPQDFLSTNWFGERSIVTMIDNNCRRYTSITRDTKHMWMNVINQFPYFCLMMLTTNLFIDGPFKTTMKVRCNEIWTMKLKPISMPSAVTNPVLGDFIKKWQTAVQLYLKDGVVSLPITQKTADRFIGA